MQCVINGKLRDLWMAQTTQAVHLIMQLVLPLGQFLSDIDSHTDALHRTHGTALKHPPYYQPTDDGGND